jgi:DNA modification methylase
MSVRILNSDCRDILPTLPAECVHCVVTSPPYWGLRDYGISGQLGLEPTVADYVETVRAVFAEVRRVLRKDGTLWLNMGDSYASAWVCNRRNVVGNGSLENGKRDNRPNRLVNGLKEKDLCGIPWRVAFALQADGWYLRSDIIWSKPNPMPESVTDRPTKAHEYVFLMSKSERYYYDAEAIAEESNFSDPRKPFAPGQIDNRGNGHDRGGGIERTFGVREKGRRNRRTVWEIATAPFPEAHFATFPPALVEPCILAGCPAKCCAKCGAPWRRDTECSYEWYREPREDRNWRSVAGITRGGGMKGNANKNVITIGFSPSCSCNADVIPGTVIDPFGGAGTTGIVADRLGRNAILIELNTKYAAMAEGRIASDAGMFSQVIVER